MTLGDAFTSAEGVDTDAAWPRLLERDLAERENPRPVQVQNFAITGYGPNQYVAVARAYLPQFRPDVLLVTMFVNEFDDAEKTDRQFRQSIGFGRTPADSTVCRAGARSSVRVAAGSPRERVVWGLRGSPGAAGRRRTAS